MEYVHKKLKTIILSALLLIACCFTSAKAVVIELSLVVDASGSINSTEFALQTGAYESIFTNNFVSTFVDPMDQLYVNAIRFATSASEVIPWTLLDSDMAATSFGMALGGISQSGNGGLTDHAEATNLAASSILGNGINGDRLLIDVSTDGNTTSGGDPIAAATAAAASGISVNAIGIGSGVDSAFLDAFTMAGDGFFLTASDFTDFETVLSQKLEREVTGGDDPVSVPEPSSIILLSAGLLGMTVARRRKII